MIDSEERALLLHETARLGEEIKEYNRLVGLIESRRNMSATEQQKFAALKKASLKVDDAVSNPASIELPNDDAKFQRVLAMVERATETMQEINQELRKLLVR